MAKNASIYELSKILVLLKKFCEEPINKHYWYGEGRGMGPSA